MGLQSERSFESPFVFVHHSAKTLYFIDIFIFFTLFYGSESNAQAFAIYPYES